MTFVQQRGAVSLSETSLLVLHAIPKLLKRETTLKIVFAIMWMTFLFISGSNINFQFIDRGSNHVYSSRKASSLKSVQ